MKYNLYLVTILDIIYSNSLYIILSIITGIAVDRFYGAFDEVRYKQMHIYYLVFDILVHILLLSLVLFICRNLVINTFSPMSKIKGYDRSNLYQLNNATIFTAMLFVFQNNLIKKISHLHERIQKIRIMNQK